MRDFMTRYDGSAIVIGGPPETGRIAVPREDPRALPLRRDRRLTGLPIGSTGHGFIHWRKWPGRAACGLAVSGMGDWEQAPSCPACLALVSSWYPGARYHVLALSSLDGHDISGDSSFKDHQLLDFHTYEAADTVRRWLAGRTLFFKRRLNLKPDFVVQLDLRLIPERDLWAPVPGQMEDPMAGMQGVIASKMQGAMQGDRGSEMQGDTQMTSSAGRRPSQP